MIEDLAQTSIGLEDIATVVRVLPRKLVVKMGMQVRCLIECVRAVVGWCTLMTDIFEMRDYNNLIKAPTVIFSTKSGAVERGEVCVYVCKRERLASRLI